MFCADGGNGIWPRADNLINELGIEGAKRILDYTHAKQNLGIIVEMICEKLKLPDKEAGKLSKQIFEQLWKGNINRIVDIVQERLSSAKKSLKVALKKLGKYFKDHSKFQYRMFRGNGLQKGHSTYHKPSRQRCRYVLEKRKRQEDGLFTVYRFDRQAENCV